MNGTLRLASIRQTARRGEAPLDTSHWQINSAPLRSIFATWEERKRFRWQLEQMSRDNPHLIDDIGLTRRQVEAEIAKPFWRR